MSTWGDIGDVILASLSPAAYGAVRGIKDRNAQEQAIPTAQTLTDWKNKGWSSDANFNGDEWTKGLMGLSGMNPDMSNPYIANSVNNFASKAQEEKSYSDQLQRMGRSSDEALSVSQFALNPAITPHLKTLESAPGVFSPPTATDSSFADAAHDVSGLLSPVTETKNLPEAGPPSPGGGLPTRAVTESHPRTLQDIYKGMLDVAGKYPNLNKDQFNTLANITEKAGTAMYPKSSADKVMPHVDKWINKKEQQTFQYDPSAPGKDKYVIPIGAAHPPSSVQGAQERAVVFGTTPVAGVPGIYYDRVARKFIDSGTGQQVGPESLRSLGLDYKQQGAEANQRGGSMSAQINAANDLYQANLPSLIKLREKVQKKGLLPPSRFRDINAINQWVDMKSSDPDMAELQGKVKLMADNLQKTIGGGQGGEWAFKVADTLLDPALAPSAFERRMKSHGHDLSTLAKSRRTFGKNPVAGQAPKDGTSTSGNTVVERRKAKDGSYLVKYSDGTIGRE